MSHFILPGLHGPLFVFLGLVAWALAYVYLTYVITPDSIGDLMTLIVAVLPVFCFFAALAVTVASFHGNHKHPVVGVIFAIIVVLAVVAPVVKYKNSDTDHRSGIRDAWKKTAGRHHPVRSTIGIMSWGLMGAILVFGSELGFVFGGWQLLQGFRLWGLCAAPGVVVFVFSIRGDSSTRNPIRRAVLALKDPDGSDTLVGRLLEPARQDQVRCWAKSEGIEVNDRGPVPAELVVKFKAVDSG
jgi:hypothetical protein